MRRLIPLFSVLLLLLAACAAEPSASSTPAANPTPAGNDLSIVSTVSPLTWLTKQIAPEAEVRGLTSQATDPHDLELTPDDRAALEQADVIAYVGEIDFQPQVEQAVDASPATAVPLTAAADELLSLEEHAHEDDHAHEQDDHPDDHDDHEHGAVDPHLWLSPAVMANYAHLLADALANADPDNAGTYRANAQAVAEELTALNAELDQILSGCEFDKAIVSHEAYAYLLAPRGLQQEGISGAAGHGGASPERLAELTGEIRAQGLPAVLSEPVEGREDAEALAAEAGVELLEINPLGSSLTPEEEQQGYPALLRQQAERFAEAMRCDGSG